MTETCKFPGCIKPHRARGYCSTHYERIRSHGDVSRGRYAEQMEWLSAHVSFDSDDCLPWPYRRDKDGYGIVSVERVPRRASRVMCELANGPPPLVSDGALHRCGKGHEGCVAPKHLYWGTQSQNMQDRVADAMGRGDPASPRAVLTADDVLAIRQRAASKERHKDLATAFGVSVGTVRDIIYRRSWAWLEAA
jgi:hypothetical protein